MPRPAIPVDVDGVAISPAQRNWLERLINLLVRTEPTRPAPAILDHALSSFRLAHELKAGTWVERSVIQLGGGAGAVLRRPEVLPRED